MGIGISGISRKEMFKSLGIVSDGPRFDDMIEAAYKAEEMRLYSMQHDDTKIERKGSWHTALHLSSWPGDEMACIRSLTYGLMNIPDGEPISPLGRSVMDIGNQLEYQIVYRLARAGKTISGSCAVWDGAYMAQTRFELQHLWAVGSMDMALDLRPEWDSVFPVDVKGKDPDVVKDMQTGARQHDPEHYAQLQGYIHACRIVHEDMGWADMGLLPARGGAILYAARNRPRQTREFYFPYDEEFCARAEANIARVKLHFLGGSLPQRDPSWRWTETPCDWCDFKKHACKPDVKADTIQITESKAIDFSLSVNPMYSYAEARDAVLSRWGAGTKNDEEEAA